MVKMINLIIDDQTVSVPQGTLVVDAAKQLGINIPVFCYHPKMEPVGMCRMCLVEIGRPGLDKTTGELAREEDGTLKISFGPKLETACTTPVSENMVVRASSDKVKAARKDVLELLLTSHPLDCPVCDKGGECPLQNLTLAHGPATSRFIFDEKMHLDKHFPLGELIYLDRERCIQCGRCVRFQGEIASEPVIGFTERGRAMMIETNSRPGFDSIFSGNTTDICPVGALTTSDFRFGARPWELKTTASICNHCPVGCNIVFNVRREVVSGGGTAIKRVMPRQNEMVNEIWMCDKARFVYHYAENSRRLTEPMVRKQGKLVPAGWDEALALAAEKVKAAGSKMVTLAGGRLSNEDFFNLHKLNQAQGGQVVLYSSMAGGDLVAQVGLGQGTNFSEMGKGTTILVAACDLHEEAPVWWLRVRGAVKRGATLIVVNPRPTKLEKDARHVVRYTYGEESATMRAFLPGNFGDASEEFRAAAQAFGKSDNAVILFGSEGIGLGELKALAHACADLLMKTEHVGRPNNGLLGVWQSGNIQGGWDMGFRPEEEQPLADTLARAEVAWVAAADPAKDDLAYRKALESAKFVIVQELFLTETAQMADVVFPAQAFTEREGTYTSGERRVQRFYPALAPKAGTRADYAIAAQIGRLVGVELDSVSAALVAMRIAGEVEDYKDISYPLLSQTIEQVPLVGRQDLYYGGTTYDNKHGVGIQLTPAVQLGTIKLAELDLSENTSPASGELLVAPVTRLYDQGNLVLYSAIIAQRLARTAIYVHPKTAQKQGLVEGKLYQIGLKGQDYKLEICLDESAPAGVGLLPRSVGIPLTTAQALQCQLFVGI